MPEGSFARPEDSMGLIAVGGTEVERVMNVTGRERFEHMLIYCLTLLDQAKGKICAFYIDDFDDCDEHTLRVIQSLLGRGNYTTMDFVTEPGKVYKGFWAWRKKT